MPGSEGLQGPALAVWRLSGSRCASCRTGHALLERVVLVGGGGRWEILPATRRQCLTKLALGVSACFFLNRLRAASISKGAAETEDGGEPHGRLSGLAEAMVREQAGRTRAKRQAPRPERVSPREVRGGPAGCPAGLGGKPRTCGRGSTAPLGETARWQAGAEAAASASLEEARNRPRKFKLRAACPATPWHNWLRGKRSGNALQIEASFGITHPKIVFRRPRGSQPRARTLPVGFFGENRRAGICANQLFSTLTNNSFKPCFVLFRHLKLQSS